LRAGEEVNFIFRNIKYGGKQAINKTKKAGEQNTIINNA
jgi:hypothetical protein